MVTDRRFFRRNGPFSLSELAGRIDAELSQRESSAVMIEDVAALEAAAPGEISVFYDMRHLETCRNSQASAIITSQKLAELVQGKTPLLLVANPRLAFARTGHLFHPSPAILPGVHSSAHVDPSAQIGEGCQIDAGVVIGSGVKLGARCHIGPNAVIAESCVLADDCRVGPNCSISHALIGARVRIASNVAIGGPGFGFVPSPGGALRVSQLGRVIVGDNVEIDNNCTIDRGAMGDTVIGEGTMIDNLVHIAHNVQIGRHCVIAGQVGIAGSATIGDFVMMGGQAGVADHVQVGIGARIAAKSGVIKDVAAGESVGGYPALPVREWHRQTLRLRKSARKSDE